MALALVATCLVLRCYFNNPTHTPVPNWVRHIVLGWMARLCKVPVKKILHGIDPTQSSKKEPDENENSEPEPVVHKKIPNTSRNHISSSQQLHIKHLTPNLPGDIQPRINLLPSIQRRSMHRLSMPPIYDNIQVGGAMNDLISSRAPSRINLAEPATSSQPIFMNVKSTDDVTGTDNVTRALLETQTALAKDVNEMVRYIQDQEMGDLMKEEWQLIAAIIDKFFLWMFLLILCFSTVAIFMQAPSYVWK